MANWTNLKAAIAEAITTNGNQEITGAVLQNTLNAIINTIGENATFAGIAIPSTNPGVPDGPVFYLAGVSGAYSNFGITIQDEIAVIANNSGSWTKSTILRAATIEKAGVIYDVTANNNGATFASLSALLSDKKLSTLIPSTARCGGMSIRFVQSSDNKYVQYRLMSDIFNTTVTNWQGVSDIPSPDSFNLISSKGVYASLKDINDKLFDYNNLISVSSEIRGSSGGALIESNFKILNYTSSNAFIEVFEVEVGKAYKITDKNHRYTGNPNPYVIIGFSENLLTIGDTVPTILKSGSDGVTVNEVIFTAPSNGYIYTYHYNNSYFEAYEQVSKSNIKKIYEEIQEINKELDSDNESIYIRARNLILKDYKTKKFSVLGDSYSTYKGYVTPSTNRCFYGPDGEGTSDVTDIIQTWWYRVAATNGLQLDINNSYSGSTVCNTGYSGGDSSSYSFLARMDNIGTPDVIMIMGGTNDSWANVPIGEYQYSNWSTDDLKNFRPAFAKMLDYLITNHQNATIFHVTNSGLSSDITNSISTICEHYNIQNIQLVSIDQQFSGHPGKVGMNTIAEQILQVLELY